MTGEEARARRAQAAVLRFDVRDQFLAERLADGAVVVGIGKAVMAPAAVGVEADLEHVDVADPGAAGPTDRAAAEAGDAVHDGVAFRRLGRKRGRQRDRRPAASSAGRETSSGVCF